MLKDKINLDIVIDFDGTCVAFDFPTIGKSIGAEDVLKKLVKEGHKLILFTMRDGKYLEDAVNWFEINNIPLYGIQKNPTQDNWTNSNKAHGDMYIDDLGLGIPLVFEPTISKRPFVNWLVVEKLLKYRGILNYESRQK